MFGDLGGASCRRGLLWKTLLALLAWGFNPKVDVRYCLSSYNAFRDAFKTAFSDSCFLKICSLSIKEFYENGLKTRSISTESR